MPTKNLIQIALNGGNDYLNVVSARDTASVNLITSYRQAAPANTLNYTEAITKTGTITAGSNVITAMADTTGLAVGMTVYSSNLKARRDLTIASLTVNSVILAGTGNINAFVTSTEVITFGSETGGKPQLLKMADTAQAARNPAFNSRLKFFYDAFNTPDTAGNASKTKAIALVNVGPLRKKLTKNGGQLEVTGIAGVAAVSGIDIPLDLTAHDKQQVTVNVNNNGIGWGGGIQDVILPSIVGARNSPLLAVAAAGSPVFTVGANVKTFDISSAGLMAKIPNFYGKFSQGETDTAAELSLRNLMLDASTLVNANDDIGGSTVRPMSLAKEYQTILVDAMNITDPPAAVTFNITGSQATSTGILNANLKQAARLIHTLAPNRGGLATRTGNVVTIDTEVSGAGVATVIRTGTSVTVTYPNHRLFTSGTSTTDLSDSVLITDVDAVPAPDGYKITLDPSDPDNKFTFTSADSGALSNTAVTVRLKHNLFSNATERSEVYIDATNFDTATPAEGYPVTVVSPTQFTITTTASGAFSPTSKSVIFKLLNLPGQVINIDANYMGWDSHNYSNESQLAALDACCAYFDSLVSRIVNSSNVTFVMGEFGRTITTNSNGGTDHAWGGVVLGFGKDLRGMKIYGTIPNYDLDGPNSTSSFFIPTTSTYQMAYTFAKWMGLSDAQNLALFPDLANWPLAERNLGFLNALV